MNVPYDNVRECVPLSEASTRIEVVGFHVTCSRNARGSFYRYFRTLNDVNAWGVVQVSRALGGGQRHSLLYLNTDHCTHCTRYQVRLHVVRPANIPIPESVER